MTFVIYTHDTYTGESGTLAAQPVTRQEAIDYVGRVWQEMREAASDPGSVGSLQWNEAGTEAQGRFRWNDDPPLWDWAFFRLEERAGE